MGTSEFAVPSLEALRGSRCDIAAVVTPPDRPAGRGRRLQPSPVAALAARAGLRLLQPENVNATAPLAELRALGADLFVVVAFGVILSRELLAVPRRGCLNLHASLLPRYRGAAPVARALWDGCAVTGVTTIWMDEGIDAGDMALQRAVPVGPEDDAGTLGARLAAEGAVLLAGTVALAAAGKAPRTPQDHARSSYARKLVPEDGVVAWDQDAVTVWNRQRATTPRPGARAAFAGRTLLVQSASPWDLLPYPAPPGTVLGVEPGAGVRVACSPGSLLLRRVRPQDRGSMPAEAWARGARVRGGERMDAGGSPA